MGSEKLVPRSTDGKVCKGSICKGRFRPFSDFYPKGLNKSGTPRYDHICKDCKLKNGKSKRKAKSKKLKAVLETRKFEPLLCEIHESFVNDHLEYDLERFLKQFAYDLITE